MKIKQVCEDCKGTGLYSGMCEAKGTAVVCLRCEGKGWEWHHYKTFEGRKKLKGIKEIQVSRGSSILCCGGTGKAMTYKEFEAKFPVTGKKEKK